MFDQKVNIVNSDNYSVVMLLSWMCHSRCGFCWDCVSLVVCRVVFVLIKWKYL